MTDQPDWTVLGPQLRDLLDEVVTVLECPEMMSLFAFAYIQGNAYDGPKIDIVKARVLLDQTRTRH